MFSRKPRFSNGRVMEFAIAARLTPEFHLDFLRVESCGLLSLFGWGSPSAPSAPEERLRVLVNGSPAGWLRMARFRRDDVNAPGAILEYGTSAETIRDIRVQWARDGGRLKEAFRAGGLAFACREPHYAFLRAVPDVLPRERIYGFGPPSPAVNDDLRALAGQLSGRVLDFGCGRGALVETLRARGVDAEGIELNRQAILDALPASLRGHIRLYDGRWPLPYEDRSFDWVVCSEVLEHIPDYERAVSEIARVSRKGALITVPDVSAIPALHKHGVIPWHLLEATHVNFFTQESLAALLGRSFGRLEFYRICPVEVNGTTFWVSVAALARHE